MTSNIAGWQRSADYMITQSRDMPLAHWRAEVDESKKVPAAPVPDVRRAPIAQYRAPNSGNGQ